MNTMTEKEVVAAVADTVFEPSDSMGRGATRNETTLHGLASGLASMCGVPVEDVLSDLERCAEMVRAGVPRAERLERLDWP